MSSIEWTDVTWNCTVGCTRVSPGCENCYAEKVAHRGMSPQHKGLTVLGKNGVRWNGKINLVPSALEKPLRWRKPRRVFVDSMSDLFHPGVPFDYVAAVFAIMAACPQHTFQVLTKRPERMLEFFAWLRAEHHNPDHYPDDVGCILQVNVGPYWPDLREDDGGGIETGRFAQLIDVGEDYSDMGRPPTWPLPNVWLGVSVEDQQRANERIPLLAECPAAVRFLSCEPLLGPVTLGGVPGIEDVNWVIVGGEPGQGARFCDLDWVRALTLQCEEAGVACFVKQLGAKVGYFPGDPVTGYEGIPQILNLRDRKGGDMSEWPADLRVREFPEVTR